MSVTATSEGHTNRSRSLTGTGDGYRSLTGTGEGHTNR